MKRAITAGLVQDRGFLTLEGSIFVKRSSALSIANFLVSLCGESQLSVHVAGAEALHLRKATFNGLERLGPL